MSQEATIIAVDNSDYMRNGDFFPSRLQAQNDAVSLICQSKRQRNPENTLGLLSLANTEVLCTLTNDVSKIYNRLHLVEPKGSIIFCSSIRVAHLALRHRQLRHQKMRIICFIGSPILEDEKELIKLAKRLKKEKVNVDIINFGENETNQQKLSEFIDTINGKDGTGSHLISVAPGTVLHDTLVTSPVVAGEDGSGLPGTGLGLEFGLDGAEDPDLLYALRVSMEDQRMRQEHEVNADNETTTTVTTSLPAGAGTSEEAMLQQALAMSMQMNNTESPSLPMDIDLAAMSEEDQIAYALRMSLQQMGEETAHPSTTILESNKADTESSTVAMDIDQTPTKVVVNPKSSNTLSAAAESFTSPTISTSTDLDVMYDAEFLESVLQSLPGVDTQNEDVRKAISDLTRSQSQGSSSKNEKGDEDQQNN
uniref:26S proteasome non-ATPase regulatory subunit 4 n=1 Tax=Schistosoma japonicum TaxID=6182 RepID=C1LNP7_SCHJA|nr:putative phosphatidylinositol-4-phosphate 5-kinase, type I, alpha [Schistosoma japonicum]CAX76322.1 putative phosphatidylinositol-4-phosphate 5-kinase, type I, alpha [Schistosoma japonicum]CAX76325.1 putative phosphatidylinositol-4-phosphate 5-kinase, type I, alpha [Schistosoma japonicum]CAX76328.1 putative phosphatidylinositol-4-phosphate 5-kinase, type I, alpha [Schistosoma japonicum]